jgi:trans-aconitate 2-methyltransferase
VARYTYGDDEAAVQRLALVADAYAPVSSAFLLRHVATQLLLAVDLGCGPGFSTRLISQVCRPQRLIGFDGSVEFLRLAREFVPTAQFVAHDVTKVPFPVGPAGLLYARLVLAHLPDPGTIVERWRQQLRSDGVLLVEELEDIEGSYGALAEYDELSTEVVRGGGGVMFAGRLLRGFGGRVVRVSVPAAIAAAIYLFNVKRWLARTPGDVSVQRLQQLELGLSELVDKNDRRVHSWVVRQLALRP